MTESISVVHIPKKQSLGTSSKHEAAQSSAALAQSQDHFLKLEDQLQAAEQRQDAILFETCLRKIWIVKTSEKFEAIDLVSDEVLNYKSQEAYKFLLEVICGLHSPVIGETEVFGQFKEQVVKQINSKHPLFKLVSQLVTDAKDIRRQYLTHLGSQTYGSFCRRIVLNKNAVDMIGFGSFAQSILPWVAKEHIEGRVFVRDTAKYTDQTITSFAVHSLADLSNMVPSQNGSVLIICAPLMAQDLKISNYDVVVDLRETATQDPIAHNKVITLQDVFAEIQKGSEYALEQKTLALTEVQVRAKKINNSMMLRPFGWEDICA